MAWPASLAEAVSPRMSSSTPTAVITVAASTNAMGSLVVRKTGRNVGSSQATANAPNRPAYSASPPSLGSGRVLTRRPPG